MFVYCQSHGNYSTIFRKYLCWSLFRLGYFTVCNIPLIMHIQPWTYSFCTRIKASISSEEQKSHCWTNEQSQLLSRCSVTDGRQTDKWSLYSVSFIKYYELYLNLIFVTFFRSFYSLGSFLCNYYMTNSSF